MTGVGKTYLACALANAACRQGHTALYQRLPRLFEELALARTDGVLPDPDRGDGSGYTMCVACKKVMPQIKSSGSAGLYLMRSHQGEACLLEIDRCDPINQAI